MQYPEFLFYLSSRKNRKKYIYPTFPECKSPSSVLDIIVWFVLLRYCGQVIFDKIKCYHYYKVLVHLANLNYIQWPEMLGEYDF